MSTALARAQTNLIALGAAVDTVFELRFCKLPKATATSPRVPKSVVVREAAAILRREEVSRRCGADAPGDCRENAGRRDNVSATYGRLSHSGADSRSTKRFLKRGPARSQVCSAHAPRRHRRESSRAHQLGLRGRPKNTARIKSHGNQRCALLVRTLRESSRRKQVLRARREHRENQVTRRICQAPVDGSLIPSRFDADIDRHVRRDVEERAVSSIAATLTSIAGHRRRVRFDRCRGDLRGGRPRSRHAARPFREVRTRAWSMRRCCPSPVVPSVRRPVCGLSLLRPQPRALHAQLRRRDATPRPRRDPAAVSAKPCRSRSTPRAGASPSRPSARSCTLGSGSHRRRFRGRSDFSDRCPRG